MQRTIKTLELALLLGALLLPFAAFAGEECCKKTAQATKDGKTCAKCETEACCKATAEKVAKDGQAKPCEKCLASAKKK